MAVGEQIAQAESHRPAEQRVDQQAAGKFILDPIRQTRLVSNRLELMPVNPLREGSLDLFVHEEPVLLVGCMLRDPPERSDVQLNACAGINAAAAAGGHAHGRKSGRQQRERVRPLVKAKYVADWRIDQDAPREDRHAFSLAVNWTRFIYAVRCLAGIQASMSQNPLDSQTWPDLAIGLYDKLTGRGAEITYELQNLEISVPSSASPTAQHVTWRVSGTIKIRTKDESHAARA